MQRLRVRSGARLGVADQIGERARPGVTGSHRARLATVFDTRLRRTCAKLCHMNGGELEQIQFLLGHVSVLTTERYLGCKQNLEEPV